MIAKKLAIQEETTKLKDGCCIVVIQDGETKRMSYKTFLDVMQNTVEESKKEYKTVKLTADSLEKEITDIKPNIYKQLYAYNVADVKISLDMHKTQNGKTFPWNGKTVYIKYFSQEAKITVTLSLNDTTMDEPIEIKFLLIKY